MNKIQRVQAALSGKDVDYLPYSLWYHFGNQFMSGEAVADTHIAFYERYDFDYLKIMNDYTYPLPEGMDRINSIADWKKMRPVPLTHPAFAEQLKLLRKVVKRLDGEALSLETIFSPIGIAFRTAKSTMYPLMRNHPEEFKLGMAAITESLLNYIDAVYAAGVTGIFFSVNGTTDDFMTQAEFNEFARPYDLQILEAIKERSYFNVSHIHGFKLRAEDAFDYPVNAANWSHFHSVPSLAEARAMTDICLIGGVSEVRTSYAHPDVLEAQLKQAIAETGGKKFIVGPGCAIPTFMFPELIDVIRKAVRG